MPLTFTGRNVKADNTEHPSLVDIAVGLSRQPRFGGQTRRWWSVLDHTLFGDELVKAEGYARWPELRLAWLLHDAHEALTGDIPTPFKGADIKALQQDLDVRIYGAYFPGGPANAGYLSQEVKRIDVRTMRAEAVFVGPPAAESHLSGFGIAPENAEQVGEDRRELDGVIFRLKLGTPPVTWPAEPTSHPAVQEYLKRVMELL
jgi:hypothetical protein